jgi:hypothetical protein
MALKAAMLVALVLAGGCADTTPSTGSCTGSIGTTRIDGLIDPDPSFFFYHRRRTCMDTGQDELHLSYVSGALKIRGLTKRVVSILDSPDNDLLPISADASVLASWAVESPAGAPPLSGGSVTIDGTGTKNVRIKGSFEMRQADNSIAHCKFELRYAMEMNTGERVRCGGSGGGVDIDD